MKRYRITYQGKHGQHIEETWTEAQIIENYYDNWTHKMTSIEKTDQINTENCIQDWIAVNLATEITQPPTITALKIDENTLIEQLKTHLELLKAMKYDQTVIKIWENKLNRLISKLSANRAFGHGSFAEKPNN